MRFFSLVSILAMAAVCFGSPPGVDKWPEVDSTLANYLSQSDEVIECEIMSVSPKEDTLMDAAGIVYYACDVLVARSFKGKTEAHEKLRVLVPRWRSSPGPESGKRFIMFLKDSGAKGKHRMKLADMWFGLHPHDELMASRLTILVAGQGNKDRAAPPAAAAKK